MPVGESPRDTRHKDDAVTGFIGMMRSAHNGVGYRCNLLYACRQSDTLNSVRRSELVTEEEVQTLLAMPGKLVVRPFMWSIESSGHVPKTSIFESAVQASKEVLEGVVVRARFRGPKLIERGLGSFTIPESFACALFVENDRVAALDTNPQQSHSNRVGVGRPFYGKTLLNSTHRHVWVGEYGYAEPVEPPLMDVVELLKRFAVECNLTFQGNIEHPLKGETGTLL